MTRYRTIVADPPWDMGKSGGYSWREGRPSGSSRSLPYPTMTLNDIKALPVSGLAKDDAHLYVWTINRYVRDTYDIVREWGFRPAQLLATKPWSMSRWKVPRED